MRASRLAMRGGSGASCPRRTHCAAAHGPQAGMWEHALGCIAGPEVLVRCRLWQCPVPNRERPPLQHPWLAEPHLLPLWPPAAGREQAATNYAPCTCTYAVAPHLEHGALQGRGQGIGVDLVLGQQRGARLGVAQQAQHVQPDLAGNQLPPVLAKVLRGTEVGAGGPVGGRRGRYTRGHGRRIEPASLPASRAARELNSCAVSCESLGGRPLPPPLPFPLAHQQQSQLAGEVGARRAQPSRLHCDDSEGGRVDAVCLCVLVDLQRAGKDGGASWQRPERSCGQVMSREVLRRSARLREVGLLPLRCTYAPA